MSSSALTVNLLCLLTPLGRSPRCPEQRLRRTLTTWLTMTRPKTTNGSAAEQDTLIVIQPLRLRCQCSLHHQQRHLQKRARPDRSAPVAPLRIDEATPISRMKRTLQRTRASRHYRPHSHCRSSSQKIVLTSMVSKTAWTLQKQTPRRHQMQSLRRLDAAAVA